MADAGYSNGEQAEGCEAQGIVPHVPARSINNQGDGNLFDRSQFVYDEKTDSFRCPAHKSSAANKCNRTKSVWSMWLCPSLRDCRLKSLCTNSPQRFVQRHLYEGALQ